MKSTTYRVNSADFMTPLMMVQRGEFMKWMWPILTVGSALAVEGGEQCYPPGQGFMEEKVRQAYQVQLGEKELKEIVSNSKNYLLREEVNSLDRRLKFATRRETSPLVLEMQAKFEQMAQNVETEESILNYPYEGAASKVLGEDDGSLAISMENLSQEDLDFIPPETLKKLGNKISIHYMFPYDKFEHFLTYDGREIPMQRALQKISDEFEDACLRRLIENRRVRGSESRAAKTGSQQQ